MPASAPELKPLSYNDIKDLTREQRWQRYGGMVMPPLDHLALATPGPDFVRTVLDLSKTKVTKDMPRESVPEVCLGFLYRKALYMRGFQLQVGFKGQLTTATFLPGGFWILPPAFQHKNSTEDMRPGEWSDYSRVKGPRKAADVMIIGKHPGLEELSYGQNFIGKTSADLHRALREIGVTQEERDSWYVGNAIKHNRLDPTSGNMQKSWLKNCAPLLMAEIMLVRPRFILCLGTEAIKAVLGRDYTVSNMAGRVLDRTYRVPPRDAENQADYEDLDNYVDHKVLIMGVPHPAYIHRQREAYPDLRDRLEKFVELTKGAKPVNVEDDARHWAYHVERPLARKVDDILETAHAEWDFEVDGDLPVAWDAEWHGRHTNEPGAYLRTIQFAAGSVFEDAPKKATAIVLTEKGGSEGSFRSREEVAIAIRRLLDGRHSNPNFPWVPTRHGGHFFKADIRWIREFTGVDFGAYWTTPAPLPPIIDRKNPDDPGYGIDRFDGHRYRMEVASWTTDKSKNEGDRKKDPRTLPFTDPFPDRTAGHYVRKHQPYDLTRYHGGFDTGYMTHAVFEAMESYNLTSVAMRWTTCPRWDIGVEAAKIEIAKAMGIKVRDLSGYGDIPDEVILPYSTYDADATLRLFWRLNFMRSPGEGEGFLDRDVNQNSSREPFWRTMLAGLAFMEMEEAGVTVDIDRGKDLIKIFERVKEVLTESLRAELDWPKFNPNSSQQVRAWLFGEEYSGAIDKKTGEVRPILPRKDMCLGKTPIKNTGKPSKAWAQVIKHDPQHKMHTAAVDKEVLGIFAVHDDRIKKLRDIRFVRQVLQTVLRPPKIGDPVGADSDGVAFDEMDEFDGGFLSYVNPQDSRVRSRFYPVETGRCSSAGPNLQNLAKRREDDYARIQGHYDEDGQPKGDYLALFDKPLYDNPIRSIVTAGMWDGAPTVLLEFDIVSAEIAALAWESGDKKMIEDVNRNMLKESDPNYLDLHGSTAVEAFKLSCAPNKKGLKSIGKPGLRTAAKNVRFGVPYGRSAEAPGAAVPRGGRRRLGGRLSAADRQLPGPLHERLELPDGLRGAARERLSLAGRGLRPEAAVPAGRRPVDPGRAGPVGQELPDPEPGGRRHHAGHVQPAPGPRGEGAPGRVPDRAPDPRRRHSRGQDPVHRAGHDRGHPGGDAEAAGDHAPDHHRRVPLRRDPQDPQEARRIREIQRAGADKAVPVRGRLFGVPQLGAADRARPRPGAGDPGAVPGWQAIRRASSSCRSPASSSRSWGPAVRSARLLPMRPPRPPPLASTGPMTPSGTTARSRMSTCARGTTRWRRTRRSRPHCPT